MEPNYHDRDWLYQKYCVEKLSGDKIASLIGVTSAAILYWLKKCNIPSRSLREAHLGQQPHNRTLGPHNDSTWLRNKYLNEKLSAPKIARLCHTNKTVILHRLSQFMIPRRNLKEAAALSLNPAVRKKISNTIKQLWKNNPQYKKRLQEAHRGRIREQASNWKGGQAIKDGRAYVFHPGHPHANQRGYIRRSHCVIEQELGYFPKPNEVVHHINGNPMDDRIENLAIYDRRDHPKLHAQMKRGK